MYVTYHDMMVLMMTKNQDVLSPDILLKLLLSTDNQYYSHRCIACHTGIVGNGNLPEYLILYKKLNRIWGVQVKNK